MHNENDAFYVGLIWILTGIGIVIWGACKRLFM